MKNDNTVITITDWDVSRKCNGTSKWPAAVIDWFFFRRRDGSQLVIKHLATLQWAIADAIDCTANSILNKHNIHHKLNT